MSALKMSYATSYSRLLSFVMATAILLFAAAAHAAAPGITGTTFNLTAQPAYITQPDGQMVYSWGYGCDPLHPPSGYAPSAISGTFCNSMQIPGPTLIVTEASLFLYLLFSYYYLAFWSRSGFVPSPLPKFDLALPDTAILLLSSVTVWWGERGSRKSSRRLPCFRRSPQDENESRGKLPESASFRIFQSLPPTR